SIGMSAWGEEGKQEFTLSVQAADLQPNSEITVKGNEEVLVKEHSDADGWFYTEVLIPVHTSSKELTITAEATDLTGQPLNTVLTFPADSSGNLVAIDETSVYVESNNIQPVTGAWLIKELAPSLVMLMISLVAICVTASWRV